LVAALATIMGITIKTVYGLWFLCSDLVYVVLFPQLFACVYLKDTNTYGSMVAYWVGIFMRLGGGEDLFHIPPFIKFPYFDYENKVQRFPFRTTSMLTSFALTVSVSYLTKFLFENNHLRKEYDIFRCVTNIPIEAIALKDSITVDELSKLNINNNTSVRYNNEHDGMLTLGGGIVNHATAVSTDNMVKLATGGDNGDAKTNQTK
jgi:hypothetical protein